MIQAWRILTRSFLEPSLSKKLVAYTPMFHARLFAETQNKYFNQSFQPVKKTSQTLSAVQISPTKQDEPYLDGNPAFDRPLFVQFCANDPDILLEAAKRAAPYCDAVDLNLGCPQGIAKKGHYGAFLQEDWDLISRLIGKLHKELFIPVTAKIRILETRENTLEYAKMVLSAGASILTVHGRRREQKGHNTGVADWSVIRYLRENLPQDTVIFANGNILQHGDLQKCLEATGADGVMSAEGNLHDPSIFAAPPPEGTDNREYWWGPNGIGGYRMDAVIRRYLDIIYKHILNQEPPQRAPLFVSTDKWEPTATTLLEPEAEEEADEGPARKKRKKTKKDSTEGRTQNLLSMQAHLFSLLRPLITVRTDIRDVLARTVAGDMAGFEKVLSMVEGATREALIEEARSKEPIQKIAAEAEASSLLTDAEEPGSSKEESARARCKRPWWVCQSSLRPLPEEAYANGSMQLSKKQKQKLAAHQEPNGGLAKEDVALKYAVSR
jgi:tRNA-dihydrouridine synthase 1